MDNVLDKDNLGEYVKSVLSAAYLLSLFSCYLIMRFLAVYRLNYVHSQWL